MLGRAEDAELSGAEPDELVTFDAAAAQERDHPRQVVERVEPGARFDDREHGNDRSAENERLHEQLHLVEPANDARDQPEDEQEAQEEHEALVDVLRDVGDSPGVRDDRGEHADDDQRQWRLQPGAAESRTPVDQKRGGPSQHEQRHEQPIRLELERKVRRQRVAADRDEEDHQDQADDQASPTDRLQPGERRDSSRARPPRPRARRSGRLRRPPRGCRATRG